MSSMQLEKLASVAGLSGINRHDCGIDLVPICSSCSPLKDHAGIAAGLRIMEQTSQAVAVFHRCKLLCHCVQDAALSVIITSHEFTT